MCTVTSMVVALMVDLEPIITNSTFLEEWQMGSLLYYRSSDPTTHINIWEILLKHILYHTESHNDVFEHIEYCIYSNYNRQ